MTSIIEHLKHQARQLQQAAAAGDPSALARIPRTKRQTPPAPDPLEPVQRKDCLKAIARELGFKGWAHLKAVIDGEQTEDFGTLLHSQGCFAHSSIWFSSYEEAKAVRQEHGGYLLPYNHQFMLVDEHYIRTLGLDPEDERWTLIERNWVHPRDMPARTSLYAELIRQRSSPNAP